jgi:formylglycine-generating enzyme required for sulfatase activity
MKINFLLTLGFMVLMANAFFAQNPARSGKDFAVFFYVSAYQNGWERLPETKTEAEAIAAELKNSYGFQTEIVPNPTRQQVLDKIAAVNSQSFGKYDQVLFFFSMHGYFQSATQRGFLIPADGKLSDPYGASWISYDDLGSYVALNPCRHVLLALDACYSGGFGVRWKGEPGELPWEQSADCRTNIENALRYDSRLYFSSGSKTQRTPAKSLFASRWLEALRKGSEQDFIRIKDLRYYLSAIEYPHPEGGSFTGMHKEGGDFVFVHKNACSNSFQQTHRDRDGDTFPDTTDECPDEYGTARGCLDTDNDGIPNKDDQCPYEPGIAGRNGCPGPADRDGDEVPDLSDKCPDKKGPTHYQGCPDSDSDLVPDHLDNCPDEQGKPSNNGCPPTDIPDFVFVQGGNFKMPHAVTLSDFYLSRQEVTVREYLEFANVTDSNFPEWMEKGNEYNVQTGKNDYYKKLGKALTNYDHPIVGISWYNAIAYCNWRSEQDNLQKVYTISGKNVTANWKANGYRLPTEAEWEYAARSRGKDEIWAGTSSESNLSQYANASGSGDGYEYTAPGLSFRANSLGLFDMSGNVWEWCWDWYGAYPTSSQNDPRGPDAGSYRVLRGGSWSSMPANLRCANRYGGTPDYRNFYFGFRLARAAR